MKDMIYRTSVYIYSLLVWILIISSLVYFGLFDLNYVETEIDNDNIWMKIGFLAIMLLPPYILANIIIIKTKKSDENGDKKQD